jgi:hypothetical protein
VSTGTASTKLLQTQGITFRTSFRPAAGKTYELRIVATDDSGSHVSETDNLVAARGGT